MVEPFMTGTATVVATKLLSRTLDDLYDFLKTKGSLTIDRQRIQRRIPELVTRINSFRMVKTLWRMEHPVDVEEFYCASHILIPIKIKSSRIGRRSKKKRKKIDTVLDFGNIGNIVITGIAGQGKSIFLRHLFIREFEQGLRIPVFIELRKIQENESLFEHITRFLDILELKINSRLFQTLARSGKFIYFLDAFDEVPEKVKQKILNQLEYLALSAPDSQFIVTTRPNTGIEMSTLFTITTLDDLKNNEYQAMIRKLSASTQSANTLIKTIKRHESKVRDLLCTPLLVTLLIIQYTSFQKLPEQMSEFYESIFSVLLHRHDRSKPGFVRHRLCSLNDNQYREVFNAFCFESMKTDKSELSISDIQKSILKSIQILNLSEDPLNFLDDISKITCLILHEGEEFRFIHNSVKEYYAASFLSNRTDNQANGFYSACKSDFTTSFKWNQVLAFLSEIDKYLYFKYYLIPLCHNWLNVDNDKDLVGGCPISTPRLTKHIIRGLIIGFGTNIDDGVLMSLRFNTLPQILPDEEYLDLLELDYRYLTSQIKNKTISINYELLKHNYFESKSKLRHSSDRKKELDISAEQIFEEGFLVNELTLFATRIIHDIYEIWKQAYSYVKREDSLDITSGLIV